MPERIKSRSCSVKEVQAVACSSGGGTWAARSLAVSVYTRRTSM
jgi:hypothetical protein